MLNRLNQLTNLAPSNAERSIDLRDALNFFWRQWPFIATVVAATLTVGGAQLLREVPRYTANAQVLLEPRHEKNASNDILSDINLAGPGFESELEVIRSTVLLQRVAERERLTTDREFGFGKSAAGALVDLFRSYLTGGVDPKNVPTQNSPMTPADLTASVEALKGAVVVSKSKGFIINISFTSFSPARSAKLANAIADAYIVDKLDARFEAAKRASSWLSDRLTELRKQVRDSEDAVMKFRTEHNILQGTANITLNEQQLSDLKGRLVTARAELSEKKGRVDLLKNVDPSGKNIQILLPALINSPIVTALRSQLAGVAQREADLVARYGDGHPLVINVRSERRDLERQTVAEIQKLAASVKSEYEIANARAESLEKTLREVTGQTDLDSDAIITLRELQRSADINKSLFEDFLKRAKVTEEQSTFEAREARVITPALPPGSPSYPLKTRYMAITLVIGLVLGIGGAVAKELLNAGFTTPQQVEDTLEVPLLGSVTKLGPHALKVAGKDVKISEFVIMKPLSRLSESIRGIRSGVQMTDVDNPPKLLQITSTVPGEGKTTVALSIAASAAQSNLKVLFIDGDLRRPGATDLVGLKKEQGLVDLLLGQADAQDVIKFNEGMRVWFLPAGSKTQNPPDLLASERMKSLIASFKGSFDLVIIDSPPMGPVIDPVVISQLADKVVYIVRWATTPREMIKHSIQRLSGHRKVAGVVFNHVDDSQAQKYGKYGYSYYYSSRYYKNYYTE